MDTFRLLSPPEGLKLTPLFIEPAANDEARFARLEGAVQDLRNDFDTVLPSLVRLVAVEKDMKELIEQLKSLSEDPEAYTSAPPQTNFNTNTMSATENSGQMQIPGEDAVESVKASQTPETESTAPSSPVTPEAAPHEEVSSSQGAASPSSEPASSAPVSLSPSGSYLGEIKEIRVGDSPEKTRIVLDMTSEIDFTINMSNDDRTLIIDLPRMDMTNLNTAPPGSDDLVAGYRIEKNRLLIDMKYAADVLAQDFLAPDGSPYYRLVIDMARK